MISVKAKFSRIKLDDTKYLRDTERAINKVIKEAAREFLITALTVVTGAPNPVQGGSFPVQTGEAAGSFLPLAQKLAQAQQSVNFSIIPAEGRPNKVSKGRAQGSVQLGPTGRRLIYSFSFGTSVPHFQFLESNYSSRVASGTPWRAIALGYGAFLRYVNRHLTERVPKITDYLQRTEVTL